MGRPEKTEDYATKLDNLAALMGTNKAIRETAGTIVADSISAALMGYADFLRDPVAAVRSGVESGTIEGHEMEVVPTEEPRRGPYGEPIQQEPHIVSSVIEPARCLLDPGTYLVIGPVSDGGEDRP